jgi:hypothetical protein
MATSSHTQIFDQTQTIKPPGSCRTAADVRGRTAQVQAFRARVWPLQRPTPPAPQPAPEPAALAGPVLPALSTVLPGRITVRLVLDVTAAHFGVTVEALLSDTRKQPTCHRRQVAMYVAHRLTGRSLVFIGRKFGDMHHTTVLHGVRVVKALVDAGDTETVEAVTAIVEKLTGRC